LPERAYVDANVILHFLVGDPPDLAAKAVALFQRMERGEVSLILDDVILAECVWVLQSFYEEPASRIASTLRGLLLLPNLEAPHKGVLLEALTLYQEYEVDFVDALLAARSHSGGPETIYSFGRHFERLPAVARLEPR